GRLRKNLFYLSCFQFGSFTRRSYQFFDFVHPVHLVCLFAVSFYKMTIRPFSQTYEMDVGDSRNLSVNFLTRGRVVVLSVRSGSRKASFVAAVKATRIIGRAIRKPGSARPVVTERPCVAAR